MPQMVWKKDGLILPADEATTQQTPKLCKIKIDKTTRKNGGEYMLELINSTGKELIPITIKVIGKHC